MLPNFIIHIRQQYPDVRETTRLPPGITHRLAYVRQPRLKHEIGPVCWHIEDSWCALQPHRAKDVFSYSIEIEAKKRLYLPVEIVHPVTHWQYALQGGYGLQGKEKNGLILTEGQHHQIYGRHGRFVSWVPPGRHIIIGYSISSRWLKRYQHMAQPGPTAMQQELIPDIFYRNSPSDTTPAMLSHVLALIAVPAHSGIQLDTSLYTPIGKLQALHETPGNNSKNPLEQTLEAIRIYVPQQLQEGNPAPSIQAIADKFKVKKDTISSAYKKKYKTCLKEFIDDEKLKHAAKLLLEDNSVTAVTYQLGYGELSNFRRAFRKKYGLPPSQYQLKHKPRIT